MSKLPTLLLATSTEDISLCGYSSDSVFDQCKCLLAGSAGKKPDTMTSSVFSSIHETY